MVFEELRNTLEDYLTNDLRYSLRITGLQIKRRLVEAAMNIEGANGEETRSLRNIHANLALCYALIDKEEKSHEHEALAQEYM